MSVPRSIKHGSDLVDVLRGLAAFLVMISHARNFILVDFGEGAPSIFRAIFYLATGLGHFSVVIFFVLSGFLISQSVSRIDRRDPDSVLAYVIARCTRLWVVLLPALLLTAFWDCLAKSLTHSGFYHGEMQYFHSGPRGPIELDILTFIENAAFLQTIVGPVYGSNTPLWSLACEFWYYLAFLALLFCYVAVWQIEVFYYCERSDIFVRRKAIWYSNRSAFATWVGGLQALIARNDIHLWYADG